MTSNTQTEKVFHKCTALDKGSCFAYDAQIFRNEEINHNIKKIFFFPHVWATVLLLQRDTTNCSFR